MSSGIALHLSPSLDQYGRRKAESIYPPNISELALVKDGLQFSQIESFLSLTTPAIDFSILLYEIRVRQSPISDGLSRPVPGAFHRGDATEARKKTAYFVAVSAGGTQRRSW